MTTYCVHWSNEDHEYVGNAAEYPLLSWLADTAEGALNGIQALVAEVEADEQAELADQYMRGPGRGLDDRGRVVLARMRERRAVYKAAAAMFKAELSEYGHRMDDEDARALRRWMKDGK